LILAFVLVVPATAVAVSPFVDVSPGKFYEAPINWAFSNGITTGKDTTHFAPDLGVTRGESVTFLKRYHDNIVQPGIDSANAAITGLGQTVGGLPCATDQFARFNGTNWVCGSIRPVSRLEPLAAATVDSITGSVGRHASIAIGADNLPIISHYDFTNTALKVSHCTDRACSSATSSTVDTGGVGVAGWDTSIAIGADNLPIISYGDRTATSLKVAHCNNATCTSSTTATVDTGGTNDVGGFTSIAIGTDNLPIISYLYNTATETGLKVVHCSAGDCSSGGTVTKIDMGPHFGGTGWYPSIAIGADGLPVISYSDVSTQTLKVAHCDNTACTNSTITAVQSDVIEVAYSSIAIGADGLPVVSYRYSDLAGGADRDLKVAHCNNVACTTSTSTTIDTSTGFGSRSSIAIGADNLPIISYGGGVSSGVKVARCTDVTCTSASIVSVESGGNWATSIAIDAGGYPVVAYDSGPNSGTSLHVTRIDVSVIGIAFG